MQTLETAADVSVQEAEQPAGQRHALTEGFVHKGVKHDVTVDPNSADPFGTFKDHSKGEDDVGAIVEAVGTAALNVAAVLVPPLWAVAAPVDLAEAGQAFSQGNVLGGVLDLASAAGAVLGAGGSVFGIDAGDLGLTTTEAASISSSILAGVAAAGGTATVVLKLPLEEVTTSYMISDLPGR